jgi:hypothetical protein
MKPVELVNKLGLTIESEFVPFSRSRHAKPNPKVNDLSVNWRVTLKMNGREILTTDYGAGIAHCPAYKDGPPLGGIGVDTAEAIRRECETGKRAKKHGLYGEAINPDSLDVLYSLVVDSDVLEHPCFEEWAANFGYDADSRAAEKMYRACLEIALRLRSEIGDANLSALREAFVDY